MAPAAATIMLNVLIPRLLAAAAVRARHRLLREARLAFLLVLAAVQRWLLPGTQSAWICVKTPTWHADLHGEENAVIKKNSERH